MESTNWHLFVLSFDGPGPIGTWEILGGPFWSERDARLYGDEMRACGAGSVFVVQPAIGALR